MNKIMRFIQNYLIIGLPFVVACMIWQTINPDINLLNNTSKITNILWTTLGINLMIWFLMLIVFLSLMVLVPAFREKTLKRLANIKDKDEREQFITGQAAKKSYISTLSMTIFLLFFSLFSLQVIWGPPAVENEKHRGSVSISMGFSLLNKSSSGSISQDMEKASDTVVFDSKNLSLSSAALIFILLIWQILAFNMSARKLSKL